MGRRHPRIEKILVANRGEIAVRVIRACNEMGIATVAVYSDADRNGLHVMLADEAVCVGPAAPTESYLNIDAAIAAAVDTGADAIHPGYGFLAENPEFVRRCVAAKLVFIGPPADVMRSMGDKIESRNLMDKAGVPIVPGMLEGSNDVETIVSAAEDIGVPLFVKASGGGGGKGLRLVTDAGQLEGAIRTAIGEARSAFGDDTVYVEKRVESPRHIEIQVLADGHGNVVHLGERECSIQRRHQKLLEETPSTALDPELRTRIGEAAVTAARAVGYVGAGTIEFMLDKDGEFYFLEMNTRIQVEHPITEMTTGVDLVHWQIRVARGEELSFGQDDVVPRGHAIECRIYAEDAGQNFMPSCGVITCFREPDGPGVRNDSGVYDGWEVTAHYDPILSKLVTYGEDRETARRRMLSALDNYIVHGVETSIDLHRRIVSHEAFVAGETYTDFIERYGDALFAPAAVEPADEAYIAAALVDVLVDRSRGAGDAPGASGAGSTWKRVGRWEIGGGSP